tara:strand:+ start:468 stop:686 length:219 start_codon:yes stop_codon:yes gene_type:complete
MNIPDYEEVFNIILPEALPNEIVDIIESYTYDFNDILHYHGLVQCYDCGNIWDGNAQCDCWQFNFIGEIFGG